MMFFFSNLNYFKSLSVVSSLGAKCVVKKLGMFFLFRDLTVVG